MAQAARLASRLQRELKMLQIDPPPGVCAWPCNDLLTHLEAQIEGPQGTVYANGIFKLDIQVPERYPFEPPNIKFVTPVYHPNIDDGGRICLDILNLPPKGAWRPSLNLATLLASIGLLLSEPNPDDGLMGDITAEYKHDRPTFDVKARKWTEVYAIQGQRPVKIPALEIHNCETSAISSVPSKGVDRMPMEDKDGESVTMISALSHLSKQVGFSSKRLSLGRGTQNLHHDNMPNGPLYHERNLKVPQTYVPVHSSSLTNLRKVVKISAQEIQGKERKLIETQSVYGARQKDELYLRHSEDKEETSESDKQGRFSQDFPKQTRCSQEILKQERVSQEPPSKEFNNLAPGTSPNSNANKKQVEARSLETAFNGFSDVPPTQVCKRTNRSQQAPATRTDGCRRLVSREEDEDLKQALVTSRAIAESATGVMAKELKDSEKTADPHRHSGTVKIVNSASTLSGPSDESEVKKTQPWNEKENQAPKRSAFSCVVASTVDSGRGRLKLMKEAASQEQPKHVCIEAANGCHTPSLPRAKSLKLSRAKVDSHSLSVQQAQDRIRIADPERRSIPSSIVIPDDDVPTVIVSDSGSDDDGLPAEDFTFSLTQPNLITSSNKRKAGSRLR